MQRLWLTPSIRRFLRVGLPILFITGIIGLYFSNFENRERLSATVAEFRSSIEARPEFSVRMMAIDGASRNVSAAIRSTVPLDFPVSSFDLDIEAIWRDVTAIDAIRLAEIRIKSGGVLSIEVVERLPAIIWRSPRGLELLDETGAFIAVLDNRHAFPNLPLIAGDGADKAVNEALNIIATSKPLSDRVLGLVRIGDRRWDLFLDRDQRILLPTDNPIPALERVIALDQAKTLLERDLLAVDMRHSKRPTIRLNTTATEAFRQMRGDLLGGLNE
jgi:cell division protein FtsQ